MLVITEVHRDFLEAGADIIETNTYQASLQGFKEHLDLSSEETLSLIRQSVTEIARPQVEDWRATTGKHV